ncbi:hypothetical protein [Halomonas sp. KO116]|nr:hypothetical protein [Halomonas sp. KO116]AJY52348.1 hypothetical protein KO116_03881 [Halomonas sp. KO116]
MDLEPLEGFVTTRRREKLQKQESVTSVIMVFGRTNPFRSD